MQEVTPGVAHEGFKFNLFGLLNTARDNSFYKVQAYVCGKTFKFENVDWEHSTQLQFRLYEPLDYEITNVEISEASCIIYQVSKYTNSTNQH